MLRRLAPADYVTLAGLGLCWAATCLLLFDRPDALADVVVYLVPTAVLVSETLAAPSPVAIAAGGLDHQIQRPPAGAVRR